MRTRRMFVALTLTVAVTAGSVACSSGDGESSASSATPAASSGEDKAALARANAACRAGKKRTAAIETGTLVVPRPSTPAEQAATAKWASATAAELEATADALDAVEASSGTEGTLERATAAYRLAAQRLRDETASVLGDTNFLSDKALYDAGLTDCFAPIKGSGPTTTAP